MLPGLFFVGAVRIDGDVVDGDDDSDGNGNVDAILVFAACKE